MSCMNYMHECMHELYNINHNASIGKVNEHTSPPFVFYQVFFRVNHQNNQRKHTTKNFDWFINNFLWFKIRRDLECERIENYSPSSSLAKKMTINQIVGLNIIIN